MCCGLGVAYIVCVMLFFRCCCVCDWFGCYYLFVAVVMLVGVRCLRVVWFGVVWWFVLRVACLGLSICGLIVLICVPCLMLVLLVGLFVLVVCSLLLVGGYLVLGLTMCLGVWSCCCSSCLLGCFSGFDLFCLVVFWFGFTDILVGCIVY